MGIGGGILGAAVGFPLAGPVILAVWISAFSFRYSELKLRLGYATLVALIGTALETALIAAGVSSPEGTIQGTVLCPPWIIAGWFSLGIAIPSFVPRDKMGYVRIAVIGAALAPIIYLIADDLISGALHLRRPLWPSVILIALLWQGLLPALCWLAQTRWYRA